MTLLKASFYSVAAAAVLSFSTSAYANNTFANATNTTNPFLAGAVPDKSNVQYLRLFDVSALPHRGERYLGSSRTATLYFKKGVKNFEKGNLDKAARHFKAVLRADGSRGLNKATYHYLTNITHKQGDEAQAKSYAQAYYNIR
jgi:hypothetical protein